MGYYTATYLSGSFHVLYRLWLIILSRWKINFSLHSHVSLMTWQKFCIEVKLDQFSVLLSIIVTRSRVSKIQFSIVCMKNLLKNIEINLCVYNTNCKIEKLLRERFFFLFLCCSHVNFGRKKQLNLIEGIGILIVVYLNLDRISLATFLLGASIFSNWQDEKRKRSGWHLNSVDGFLTQTTNEFSWHRTRKFITNFFDLPSSFLIH